MAQRAALARALLNEPRLLLLDEPLGKLDSLTRISMQRELIALWQQQGYTSLLVTHDIEEALLLCERVLVMSPRPGRIIAEFALPLAFPRHRDNPQLLQHRQDICASSARRRTGKATHCPVAAGPGGEKGRAARATSGAPRAAIRDRDKA
jgi:ABC-type nitrate/sulfonate/bicarbonate transport system ATPase subunit